MEILAKISPGGILYGLDVDPIEQPKTEQRIRNAGYGPNTFQARATNFAGLQKLVVAESLAGLDVVLADLGVSSMQIDNPSRGFTFKADGPLDLRLNPNRGQSAADLLAKTNVDTLATLLVENSDEPKAQVIATAIMESQANTPITRTKQLATIIQSALAGPNQTLKSIDASDTLGRVFQALRIAVNNEFSALDSLLRVLPDCLKPKGRVALLTFHSGEDRRVKKAFQAGLRDGTYSSISTEITRASFEERHSNSRSTCAKLRWAIRAE